MYLYAPSNLGLSARYANYPSFKKDVELELPAGQALWLTLQQQDIISCTSTSTFWVAAIDYQTGRNAIHLVLGEEHNLKPNKPQNFDNTMLDNSMLKGRLDGLGLTYDGVDFYEFKEVLEQPVIWRAKQGIILLLALPEVAENLVDGRSTKQTLKVNYKMNQNSPIRRLPDPLGEVVDEFTISKGTAQSYELPKGSYVQIIDLEGRQCSDFMAFNSAALDKGVERHIDGTVSRSFTAGAYPRPGLLDKFYDSDIVPLLSLVQDTVGRHDTFALACTERGYEERGFPGHINCSDNISNAISKYQIQPRKAWPAVNFFFNTSISPTDNLIVSDEAWSKPGDFVLMKALTDVVCVSTACPDDIDPINGWNPTDIHVRIYNNKRHIKPAVAYRVKPNEEAIMTTESPFQSRTSQLTQQFHAGADYWSANYYDNYGTIEEYWACKQKAIIQDMSNFRIIDIIGLDSLAFLQKIMTRDISKLSLNKGVYSLICDKSGYIIDDGILYHIGNHLYRWVCSSNESLPHLQKVAKQHNYQVWMRNMTKSLCSLSVQGPLSKDILQPIIFTQPTQPVFADLKWFGSCIGRLNDRTGVPLFISRTGYTGQRGYELFCANKDAEELWDTVTKAGDKDLIPMGSNALNILRIETGLMSMPNEFGTQVDPDEAGLSFAVNLIPTALGNDTNVQIADFIGAEAIARNRIAPRRKMVGLLLDTQDLPVTGDQIYMERQSIGHITSAVFSPSLGKTIAMARVAVEYAKPDTQLEVGKLDGYMKRLTASVVTLPFIKGIAHKND